MIIKENVFFNHNVNKYNMKCNNSVPEIIIIDNFYEDPIKIRNIALLEKYQTISPTPGKRSTSFSSEEIKEKIQYIIQSYGEITYFPILNEGELNYFEGNRKFLFDNGNFNYFTAEDYNTGWIHNDHPSDWAGIVYLTPNAPLKSGIEFYQYNYENEKQEYFQGNDIDEKISSSFAGKDITKWKRIDKIGNVFNRLILFNSKIYHNIKYFFGENINNGRLTQTFWFKYKKRPYKLYKKINYNYSYLQQKIIVIDNFYKYPLDVRNIALQQIFSKGKNFPGQRTRCFANEEIKEKIQSYLLPSQKIKKFHISTDTETQYSNGCFQYTTCKDSSWIHSDDPTDWAGVLYLTPDAPLTAGTNFYKFNDDRNDVLINKFARDLTKWEIVDKIGNKFNRMVLFNAKRFHMSGDYFGTNIENGRLFQVFFFETENIFCN
jgi:hypothetical protein